MRVVRGKWYKMKNVMQLMRSKNMMNKKRVMEAKDMKTSRLKKTKS